MMKQKKDFVSQLQLHTIADALGVRVRDLFV
jgi:hypothetical protein